MSENNYSNTETNTEVNNTTENTTAQNEARSDIRYTYNPNGSGTSQNNSYNTDMNFSNKKNNFFSGNGCFISLVAILLCITVAAAGISIYTLLNANNGGTQDATQSNPPGNLILSTATPNNNGNSSAFDSVIEVLPVPTPQIVEGELLSPQQAAEKVIPSVVCIQCYTTNNYFGGSTTSSLYSEGSGIISRADGYIITNAHVIENASSVQVVLYNGTICNAQVVGSDKTTDLALLKIDPTGLELIVADFSSAAKCNVADTVLAVGNPGGLDFSSSVTSGIISALNRAVQDSSTGYVMHCIQTDTAINPGNSGGPLIDLYGNVIGITSSKIVAEGYENMGFAITYDEAAPILNDLLNYGRVRNRASINITLALPSSVFRVSSWSSIPTGLCITAISGENEINAGLKQYDIIHAIDDKVIRSMSEYSSYLLSKKPGDTVKLTIYRANISGWSVQYSSTPTVIELTLSEAK